MAEDNAGPDNGRHRSGNGRAKRRYRVFSPLGGVLLLAVAGLVSTVGVLASSATGNTSGLVATEGPLDDTFYDLPSPLPAGNPGDIIRYRPMKPGTPNAQGLANAWQIIYLSTDAKGNPNAVTGAVIVPKATDPATAKVVAMAPGTSGISLGCAPSQFINEGSFYEQPELNALLTAGYAVSITDYEGYYHGGKPTYMVGKSMGAAVLNGVRAATRLSVAGLSSSPDVVVQGYSQGGTASMWAGQLWSDPSKNYKDIKLKGIAAGGVPANLGAVGSFINGGATAPSDPVAGTEGNNNHLGFGFFATALVGIGNAYGLDVNAGLTATAQQAWAHISTGYCTVETLYNFRGTTINTQITSGTPFYVATPEWINALSDSTLAGTTAPATPWIDASIPVFHYHGVGDDIVGYKQDFTVRNQYCAAGVNDLWNAYPWFSHTDGISYGKADVLTFIAHRFAGAPFANNCSVAIPSTGSIPAV